MRLLKEQLVDKDLLQQAAYGEITLENADAGLYGCLEPTRTHGKCEKNKEEHLWYI